MDSSNLAILALSVYAGRLVTIAEGTHPFPSRTRSLSPPALTILQGQPCGTIRRCRSPRLHSLRRRLLASSFALSLPLVHPETGKVTLPVHGYEMYHSCVSTCGEAGDYSGGDTPVPIPNTVVKLSSPDDTAGAALWDNKTLPVSPRVEPFTRWHSRYARSNLAGASGLFVDTELPASGRERAREKGGCNACG